MRRKLMLSFALAAVIGLAWAENAQAQVYFSFGRGGWYGGGWYPHYGYRAGYPSYYGRWGYYRPYYGYYGWAPSYRDYYPAYSPYYSAPTIYYTEPYYPAVSSTATELGYQSFYSGPSAGRNQAWLRIELPTPDARIWLEGTLTEQAGTDRRFISPPLEPGQLYVYTVRAAWKEGDQEITREKRVNVRAGEEALVSFR